MPLSVQITYREVLRLAVPASIAALVTPLLGLTDATVLGYSSRPFDIGAVGLAAAVFSLAYWTFGFLRMSTAGLAAQAIGAGDEAAARRILSQSIILGVIVGLILLLLHRPLGDAAFFVMTRDAAIEPATLEAAQAYFSIRIWGGPFVMITYGILGWLTARGRTDLLMGIVTIMTVLNAGLDVLFVMSYGWGAAGIAAGTLVAEITGALLAVIAVVYILQRHDGLTAHWKNIQFLKGDTLKKLLLVNFDIFIRTAILVAAFAYLTQRSATYGDLVLSTNQLLLQFFLVTGLALDGPAIAAESLVGRALGRPERESRREAFRQAVRKTALVSLVAALGMCALYFATKDALIGLVAPDPAINEAAQNYFPWIIISPLIVAAAFQMDGIYIGATRSAALRNSMIVSGLVYLGAVYWLTEKWQNHGLWAAFSIFMITRAVMLLAYWPGFSKMIEDQKTT